MYWFLQQNKPTKGPEEIITAYDVPTKPSTVTIPIALSLDRIEDGLRKKIRKLRFEHQTTLAINQKRKEKRAEKGKDPSGMPVNVLLDMDLKSFNLTANGNELVARATYDMQFKVTRDNDKQKELASCGYGDGKPRVGFVLKSKFKMLPSGEVVLSNKRWDLQWEQPCVLSVLNMITISANEFLERPAIKEKLDNLLDTVVTNQIPQEIDVIPMLNKTWLSLQKPLRLGPEMFLNLNPQQVMLGDLVGNGNVLDLTVTAACLPTLTAGEADTLETNALVLVDSLKTSDSLRINLVTALPLDKLEHLVNTALRRKPINTGDIEVKMGRIRAYQHNDNVVFRIRMIKPFRGEIFLQGKPAYDPVNEAISFASFNYTVETVEMLGRLTNAVVDPTLLKSTIEDELKKVTDKQLAKVTNKYEAFSKELKNDIVVSGGIQSVKPQDLVVSDNQIMLLSEVTGVFRVEVNRRSGKLTEKPLITGAAAAAKLVN